MNLLQKIEADSNVIKHSSVIHISNTLTLLDRKVFNVLLKNAYADFHKKDFFYISIQELKKVIGWNKKESINELEKCLTKLIDTRIKINIFGKDKQKERSKDIPLLGARDLNIKKGYCRYEYTKMLKELMQTPNIYAKIDLNIQKKFKSKHSIALWEFLVEALCVSKRNQIKTDWISLDDFKLLLALEEERYKEFKHLNQRIVKPAIKEINSVSNIEIDVEMLAEGRKVTHLSFFAKKLKSFSEGLKTPLKTINKKQPKDLFSFSQEKNIKIINDNSKPQFTEKEIEYIKNFLRNETEEDINSFIKRMEKEKKDFKQIKQSIQVMKEDEEKIQIKSRIAYLISCVQNKRKPKVTEEEMKQKAKKLQTQNQAQQLAKETQEKENQQKINKFLMTGKYAQIQQKIKEEYGDVVFDKWFKEIEIEEYNEKQTTLKTPSDFHATWIAREYIKENHHSKNNKTLQEIWQSVDRGNEVLRVKS